ncbi:MAG: AsnC family transcriptional regulator [Ignavibacteria bacterium RIFOXYB2_FULL_35_12]|nr:MAG: AsnC family transcriptional regulator [Ignavibacteria bacterium GWA2_36_19]OGU57626.1 MAG: AsnC family transcriptional regulator [Ignavibacteria bacterium GWF2_35_20]OGU82106.1 MAG: AsnC family transcriptional regulator [Ignavibacteria bacterium RIFOXYA2_FULL_35_9]OGU84446.1 MAG: AsnC family transcriptional regulator [Ignavibacteria bacterium RIFOXYA12_FULL_35_25]OGU86639.1 MAG: AsnC family transcriptional regulator [Ignavibacteria bacterium RIFOXYC12_FULL_35_11]OGU95271.1 MAG: AsnC fa
MLDDLDIKVLKILQKEGRTKRNELADAAGLSIPAISERLNKLEEKKIIEGYYAKLNRKAFGYDIMAYILVMMESSKHYKSLISHVDKLPQIIECHSVLGEGSHLLKAISKNTEALEKLLADIQSWPGVIATKTTFVLSTIKETTEIDI